MPGILPMKVIKIGTQAQARIAQACDRCRSKKIRCDGIRPSCSQCVNVGFECKTSDKLSRRAFPRGYTESLEERVRSLESEVRELKALLDEKDENIDVLSRIHSHSSQPGLRRKSFSPSPDIPEQEKEETIKLVQSPTLLDNENSDSYFMGSSCGRSLIDAFEHKLQESGRSGHDINSAIFFRPDRDNVKNCASSNTISWTAPARLVSDQLINIFFQEWAPLFPVLHKPTFLKLYEDYVACPEAMEDKKSLAQLNLVFSIAAYSSNTDFTKEMKSFDSQWQAALEQVLMEGSIAVLQTLLLAQICCQQNADYSRLLKYKGITVSLSQRLGLHQSQKRFTLGALTCETRKRLFWTLYTLDCFSSAQLGLPRMIREEDAQCEYPVDADDEYINEQGFLPTLPGEFTKISSALALFKASRILAKVLTEIYPSSASNDISFRQLETLSDELDDWQDSLSSHLRLHFVQDKPSTNVVSSRSPLLSLTYQYIRSLIYRPVVCASSSLGNRAGSATVALAGASKHIIQIVELLEERSLAFSFCLTKKDLLVLSGFGVLFQSLARDDSGSLSHNNQKLVHSVAGMLKRSRSKNSREFKRIARTFAPTSPEETPSARRTPLLSRHNSDGIMATSSDTISSTQRHIKNIMSRFSSIKPSRPSSECGPNSRRATLPVIGLSQYRKPSHTSLSSTNSEPALMARSEPTLSPHLTHSTLSLSPNQDRPSTSAPRQAPNLDYLPLGTPPVLTYANGKSYTNATDSTDWERLLSSLDNGQANIYDGIYGGPQVQALMDDSQIPQSSDGSYAWSPDLWAINSHGYPSSTQPAPQSVLSFSDESLTSGEEFAELSASISNEGMYRGIVIPEMSPLGGGLDSGFGL
ncbi:hypothetical protein EJ08DRAFT_652231 [Tothia fuscella]|uniref:Zn(2)-C6 fungal-type domain-containing protein n=1 Tax=Tothia fuscella TaxID=1048955 RepID=A0A9P4TVS1_9PEZI|nr:hypothetical protein EJ08DRAFT_652231 [Tothia fuscella]